MKEISTTNSLQDLINEYDRSIKIIKEIINCKKMEMKNASPKKPWELRNQILQYQKIAVELAAIKQKLTHYYDYSRR